MAKFYCRLRRNLNPLTMFVNEKSCPRSHWADRMAIPLQWRSVSNLSSDRACFENGNGDESGWQLKPRDLLWRDCKTEWCIFRKICNFFAWRCSGRLKSEKKQVVSQLCTKDRRFFISQICTNTWDTKKSIKSFLVFMPWIKLGIK